MNQETKASIYLVLATIFGVIASLSIIDMLLLILGDIFAGALSGTAETGWGFLIATVVFGPIAVITGLLTFWISKKYKRVSLRSPKTIYILSIIIALVIYAFRYV